MQPRTPQSARNKAMQDFATLEIVHPELSPVSPDIMSNEAFLFTGMIREPL